MKKISKNCYTILTKSDYSGLQPFFRQKSAEESSALWVFLLSEPKQHILFQGDSVYFSGAKHGELFVLQEICRYLEPGQPAGKRLAELLFIEGEALLHGHAGTDLLAEEVAGDTKHFYHAHALNCGNLRFYLAGHYVLAAADYQLLQPSGQPEIAVFRETAQVSGVEPAVFVDGLVLRPYLIVSGHEVVALHQYLSLLAGETVPAGDVVLYLDVDIRHGLAYGVEEMLLGVAVI